ncbi:hypothetical protein HY772_07510 [Candidatus Woesearchaeota archaeon]|nr:hypothetical protein [Candidatus Woesearchaeota archaeon]
MSETVTIPAVIIPENGQPFSTTFDRPRYLNIDVQELEDRLVIPAREEQRRKIEEVKNQIEQKLQEKTAIGMTVYRVGGGQSSLFSPDHSDPFQARYWTNLDPRLGHFIVPTRIGPKSYYRVRAGLPNNNTGVCLAIGELIDAADLFEKPHRALPATPRPPDPDDYSWQEGGWPEIEIPNARLRVKIVPGNECITMSPPF